MINKELHKVIIKHMSLFDDENTIMKNAEKLDKFLAARIWLEEHCGKYVIYNEEYDKELYSEYNSPSSNVYPVTYVVKRRTDENPIYYPDTQFFTRVELDWKGFKVVLNPKSPSHKLFVRELHDKTPDFIDFSLVNIFSVDKYKVRHE